MGAAVDGDLGRREFVPVAAVTKCGHMTGGGQPREGVSAERQRIPSGLEMQRGVCAGTFRNAEKRK